jgi:hypothetical protein
MSVVAHSPDGIPDFPPIPGIGLVTGFLFVFSLTFK